jgi:plasmid maintenance system antidote protein VapI
VRGDVDPSPAGCPNCDMPERRYQTMTEALRDALLTDPRSYNEVSQITGLARTSLMAFAEGRRSLRLDLADKLAAFYGLTITLEAKE